MLKICLKANERDVYEFFSRAGKVSICNFFGSYGSYILFYRVFLGNVE